VSQIARSIARHLGLNETLAEVIALSHDLGHTPFGHAGGDELDRVLKKHGFVNGFEHNFQSFRAVTRLEKRYPDFDGLNLTFATLEGILKHSYPYQKPFFSAAIARDFSLDSHPSFEAMIVDNADEIAYISHDIDDGVKCGLIELADLEESELVSEVMATVCSDGTAPEGNIFHYRFVAALINTLVYSFLEGSDRTQISTDRVMCAALPANQKVPLGFGDSMERKIKILKKILFTKLYRHEQVNRKMFFGRQCIAALFEDFMNEKNLLPREYQEKITQGQKHHRVVADYIAGMSDRYAISLYQELHIG